MFRSIISFFKNLFSYPSYQDGLEAYIVAGNPQDASDVDRLEREYNRRKQEIYFGKYY
jgi:hypothetical protein